MWEIWTKLILRNTTDDNIYLKLPQNMDIVINNCFYRYRYEKNFFMELIITCYIDNLCKDEAENKFYEYVESSNAILSFLYQIPIGDSSLGICGISEVSYGRKVITNQTKSRNINNLVFFLDSLKLLDEKMFKIADKCIDYFARSLKFYENNFFEEAFLSAFKGIEIISNYVYKNNYMNVFKKRNNDYFDDMLALNYDESYSNEGLDKEVKKAVLNELKRLTTIRRKIVLTMKYLKVDNQYNNIGEFVSLRNSVVAHGSTGSLNEKVNLVIDCMMLSKFVISKFVLKNKHKKAYLDGEVR